MKTKLILLVLILSSCNIEQINDLTEAIENLQIEINDLKIEIDTLNSDIDNLEYDVNIIEQVQEINYASLQNQITILAETIDENQTVLQSQLNALNDLVVVLSVQFTQQQELINQIEINQITLELEFQQDLENLQNVIDGQISDLNSLITSGQQVTDSFLEELQEQIGALVELTTQQAEQITQLQETSSNNPFIMSLVVTSNNDEWGTVSQSSGQYPYGTQLTLTAIPNTEKGYRFVRWVGVLTSSTQNPYTITVTRNQVIEAIFERSIFIP
jgi:hypothetical protein